jgi:tRNA A-37 threonylcarbamoyl transferase component Bud32/tetratricopeptide (TPR) repeat protein
MPELRDDLQAALGAAYSLERELGGGGMSRVFVAEETALGRKVVVKVLSPELAAGVNVDRFRREIQLAARLQQAQIVPVLTAGELNGLPYYTMPLVEGESLRARLAHGLPISEVVNILRDVTRALAYAHEHGVVHRDIKPDNVLLSGGTAVVTDFGIAKAIFAAREDRPERAESARDLHAALTQMGTSVGTPAYISPEQASGDPDIDARSDIYSLGCMAYELLTGKPPFAGRTPQKTLVAHLTEKPIPVEQVRADVPPALAQLVARCLEKEPARRPQSAIEVAAALDAVTTASSGSIDSVLAGPGAAKRGLVIAAIAGVIVIVLAKAAVIGFGVPDWVFGGSLLVVGMCLALTFAMASGKTRLTWRSTFRVAGLMVASFAALIVVTMILRTFGIGPAASLLAAGKLHGRERLVVVDFNAGKDSSLSHVVTEAVRTNLGQSQAVSIMPPAAVAAALQRMQRPPTTPVDVALARDIAIREGAKAIVAGDVTPLGAGYIVSLKLVAADSGNDLAAYRATVTGPAELLTAIDDLTRKLRGRIGESLKAVRDAPALDQVTTSSLEALKKYAEANRSFDLQADYVKAAQLLREAVAFDTTFAMAYRKLGVALSNNGMPRAQVDSALTRAYKFADRLPDKEKYITIATYYQTGPGLDRQKAAEAWQHALALDSTDVIAAVNLANNYRGRRQLARAESLYSTVNRTSRAPQVSLGNEAGVLLAQGKVAASESVYAEIKRRFPAVPIAQTYPAIFMYARGQMDSAEAFWRVRRTSTDPLAALNAVGNLTGFAVLRGRLGEAGKLAVETRRLNAARGVPPNPLADSMENAAGTIWFFEQHDKGVRTLDAALAQTPLRSLPVTRRPYFAIASYYSWAGRPDKARAIVAQYDADVREPALRRNMEPGKHAAMGEILLAEKKPLDAVREFWASDSLPDGPLSECASCIYDNIGRAYDLANKPDSAIYYWEKRIADPGTRSAGRDGFILAGIEKRLGELYEAKGDVPKAISYYSQFIELWKNADPELQPKVAEVKKRLTALQTKERR